MSTVTWWMHDLGERGADDAAADIGALAHDLRVRELALLPRALLGSQDQAKLNPHLMLS